MPTPLTLDSGGAATPGLASRRWTLVNIAGAGLLMGLVAEPVSALLIGAAATLVAAVTGAQAARRRLALLGRTPSPLDMALAWIPGFIALALAAVGLDLIATSSASEPLRYVGLALFLMQIAVIAAVDAAPGLDAPSRSL